MHAMHSLEICETIGARRHLVTIIQWFWLICALRKACDWCYEIFRIMKSMWNAKVVCSCNRAELQWRGWSPIRSQRWTYWFSHDERAMSSIQVGELNRDCSLQFVDQLLLKKIFLQEHESAWMSLKSASDWIFRISSEWDWRVEE